MKYKQLIIVVESNQKSKSDYMYINSFLEFFFEIGPYIKLVPVYMNGKNNFNSKKIENIIKKAVKEYSNGESHVVYCYDTDNCESDPSDRDFDLRINEYCNKHGYWIVHFTRDIEEVFLGKQISATSKSKEAENFLRSRKISNVDINKFKSKLKRKSFSNLYLVFCEWLDPK